MDPLAEQKNDSPPLPRGRAARAPFVERKRAERRHARVRAAALVVEQLTPEQAAHDPLPPLRGGGLSRRSAWVLAMLIGSVAVHIAILAVGFALGGREKGKKENLRQEVKIEVRETKVEPPPPPVEKPPEPERRMKTPPKVVEAPEPPPPKTPPPSKAPPRVVGLSMESTTEGGGGPSFAVGNTREGKTAAKAQSPADVQRIAPPVAEVEDEKVNKAATRIPVAGVTITQPKRKSAKKPHYPETLKSQGIEADVPVMLSLDETGKVVKVKILKPSQYPEFDEAARKAAMEEEFEPALKADVPMAFTISFTYRFRLEDE
jgi:periplasmic protein TonB